MSRPDRPPKVPSFDGTFPSSYEQLVARIQAQHPGWTLPQVERCIAEESR